MMTLPMNDHMRRCLEPDHASWLLASLWKQRLDLEHRDVTSKEFASYCASKMAKRRHEKPRIDNERALLEAEMQLTLFR